MVFDLSNLTQRQRRPIVKAIRRVEGSQKGQPFDLAVLGVPNPIRFKWVGWRDRAELRGFSGYAVPGYLWEDGVYPTILLGKWLLRWAYSKPRIRVSPLIVHEISHHVDYWWLGRVEEGDTHRRYRQNSHNLLCKHQPQHGWLDKETSYYYRVGEAEAEWFTRYFGGFRANRRYRHPAWDETLDSGLAAQL